MSKKLPNVLTQDPRLRTDLAPVLKSRITQHENAIRDLAFQGAAHPEDRQAILEYAQSTRNELEQLILDHLEKVRSGS